MRKAFNIEFEDEYVIVLNKKSKILVHRAKNEKYTLTSLLNEELKKKKEEAFPCHRLDRETTGLIIYAKDKRIQRAVMEEFKKRKVGKKYLAFVQGRLKKKRGKLEGYILDKEGRLFRERPRRAETLYKVVKEYRGFSVLELQPLTGRRNQLRIQLAKIGHPVLGEDKYALRRDFPVNLRRLALHAYFLSFIHPVSKERIEIKIDLPEDMKRFLSYIQK